RHAARKRRRSGAGGGKLKTKEEGRDRKQCPAAADEVSRITPHGLLPTIPVLISRVNPREGSRTASGDSRGARGGRRGALLNPLRKRMIFRWAGAEQLARRFRHSNFPAARRSTISKARRPQRSRDGQEPIRASCVGRAAGRPFPPPRARPVIEGVVDRLGRLRPRLFLGRLRPRLFCRESVRSFSAGAPRNARLRL